MHNAISIEFPANVQNTDKAIDAIGGPNALVTAVETNGERPLQLRLRPGDPFEHPIESRLASNRDVLVKVTLPKRELEKAGGNLRLALANIGKDKYTVEPEYVCDPVFKFREMADFQWNTQDSRFAKLAKESIFAGDYSKIKQFPDFEGPVFDGPDSNLDIIPPPRFSLMHAPFPYAYRQNPSVVVTQDATTGETKMTNRSLPAKLASVFITFEEPTPTGPPSTLKEPQGLIKECVDALKTYFDSCPMSMRQPIELALPPHLRFQLRQALPYVVYQFQSGPFRRAYVKYGVDPRTDPKYSIYQVEFFRITGKKTLANDKSTPLTQQTYTFDGIHIPKVAGIQLCDVTDPQIAAMIKNAGLRTKLDITDGWFVSQDIQAIRKLMRYKLLCLTQGKPIDPVEVNRIVENRAKEGAIEEDEEYPEEDEDYHGSEESDEA